MADRIRNIQNKIKSKIENGDELSSMIAYIPLFGWVIAKFLNKNKDQLSEFHIQQAKEINLTILMIYLFIWFLEHFPLFSWLFGKKGFLYPIAESIWLVSFLSYIGISLYSVYKALNDEVWSYPYREEINHNFKKFLEKLKSNLEK